MSYATIFWRLLRGIHQPHAFLPWHPIPPRCCSNAVMASVGVSQFQHVSTQHNHHNHMFVLFKDPCRSETLWNNVDHRCEGRVPLTTLVLELALGIGCPPSLTTKLQTIHQAALVNSKWVTDDHHPTDHWARHRRGRESRWCCPCLWRWPRNASDVSILRVILWVYLAKRPWSSRSDLHKISFPIKGRVTDEWTFCDRFQWKLICVMWPDDW